MLAVVMVLQRLEGCSDREACDRFAHGQRWRYAAGVDDEAPGFVHTALVGLCARLRASADPDRIFRVTTELARQAGLVGVRRMLDSPPTLLGLASAGVVRISLGSAVARAAHAVAARAARELVDGTYDSTADGIPYDKTNDALASRPAIQGVR
jgi:hypothetical protein